MFFCTDLSVLWFSLYWLCDLHWVIQETADSDFGKQVLNTFTDSLPGANKGRHNSFKDQYSCWALSIAPHEIWPLPSSKSISWDTIYLEKKNCGRTPRICSIHHALHSSCRATPHIYPKLVLRTWRLDFENKDWSQNLGGYKTVLT